VKVQEMKYIICHEKKQRTVVKKTINKVEITDKTLERKSVDLGIRIEFINQEQQQKNPQTKNRIVNLFSESFLKKAFGKINAL